MNKPHKRRRMQKPYKPKDERVGIVEICLHEMQQTDGQRAWETAMGMRGYAGSPAERDDRADD